MGSSSILAITLVPVLMLLLIRGQVATENAQSVFAGHAGDLSADPAFLLALPWLTIP